MLFYYLPFRHYLWTKSDMSIIQCVVKLRKSSGQVEFLLETAGLCSLPSFYGSNSNSKKATRQASSQDLEWWQCPSTQHFRLAFEPCNQVSQIPLCRREARALQEKVCTHQRSHHDPVFQRSEQLQRRASWYRCQWI